MTLGYAVAIVVPNEDTISATGKPLGTFFIFTTSEEVLWLRTTDPFTNPSLVAVVDFGLVALRGRGFLRLAGARQRIAGHGRRR